MPTLEEKVAEAKRKAAEMKAKAAAKKAAKAEAAAAAPPPPAEPPADDLFLLGDHNVILVDWDDTLFPTSAWKDRIREGSTQPPRASKVQALSEAISGFVRELQKAGDVKIVTHGTSKWYAHSSSILLPETRALLDALPHRYRDSGDGKYMHKKPGGKYITDIGVQVDDYGEWYKTDMFFHFISERKVARKWDAQHKPEQVTLPRQVLIVGDGHAEKRSYDEHGNQARLYASRPGHGAVAQVGLKGVFLKDGPSYDELVLQLRWATAQILPTFLPPHDAAMKMWDLTGFPEWVCSLKAGPNAYSPIGRGSLLEGATAVAMSGLAHASAHASTSDAAAAQAAAAEQEELDMQEAIALSLG